MSFFSDVLDSIGGDKAPAPPKPVKRPTSVDSSSLSKHVSNLGLNGTPIPHSGVKRKADDGLRTQPEKTVKANPTPGLTSSIKMGQPPLSTGDSRPSAAKPGTPSAPVAAVSATARAPPKGSYADIMARAKAAQEQRGNNQVGMIKHQPISREKMSRMAERKRDDDEKAKRIKSNLGPQSGSRGRGGKVGGNSTFRSGQKSRSSSPAKRPVVPKAARPPMHGPGGGYKGTMGKSSENRRAEGTRTVVRGTTSRERAQQKANRYDEYLATDEEDNSDVVEEGEEGEEGYGSDASSDMEAGAFDIDEEENRALKAAKLDDAKEHELEQRLKKEKEERRRRLQAMANKAK